MAFGRKNVNRLLLAHEALERFLHLPSEHTQEEVEDARAFVASLIQENQDQVNKMRARYRAKARDKASLRLRPRQREALELLFDDPHAWRDVNPRTLRSLSSKGMIYRTRTPTGALVFKPTAKGGDLCRSKNTKT
jgi:hypothetical protein